MKLRNYFLLSIVVGAAVACSTEDLPDVPAVRVPDAMLSLAIDVDGKLSTKADDVNTGLVTLDERIQSLHVFVFDTDGNCIAGKDSTLTGDDLNEVSEVAGNKKYKTANQVLDIPVVSGNAQVLVIANGSVNAQGYNGTLETLCSETNATTLDTELPGFYTMSSRIMNVSIAVGKTNCMGYTDNEVSGKTNGVSIFQEQNVNKAVKLYRSIANVRLGNLKVSETTKNNIGEPVKFVLDTVFVANVKSRSLLAANSTASNWGGALEMTLSKSADWWYGAVEDQTGEYKKIEGGTKKSDLLLKVPENNVTINADNQPQLMDNIFQVYENTGAEGYQTLLIVRGDYTYIPTGGTEEITVHDRYYTIPVNQDFDGNIIGDGNYTGVGVHKGIKRNVQYNINLTISGDGSSKAYDKDAMACINVSIDVEKWGVVNMNETLE